MAYLIDTDILIYSLKDNKIVNSRFADNENIPKFISIITYGELLYGARKSMHPSRNTAVVYRLRDLFTIIPVDLPVIETFSELKAKNEKKGLVIDDFDLLTASTALSNNFTIVTNNEKHYGKIDGLVMENWSKK